MESREAQAQVGKGTCDTQTTWPSAQMLRTRDCSGALVRRGFGTEMVYAVGLTLTRTIMLRTRTAMEVHCSSFSAGRGHASATQFADGPQ